MGTVYPRAELREAMVHLALKGRHPPSSEPSHLSIYS